MRAAVIPTHAAITLTSRPPRERKPHVPPRSLVRAFLTLYVTVGIIVCLESVQTVRAALRGGFSAHDRPHALVLGALEAAAAILFLIPQTMRWGAAGLLVIFALAFGLHLVGGHPNFDLLIFAAGRSVHPSSRCGGYRWSPAAA